MFKNKEGKVRSGWKIAGMFGAVLSASVLVGVIIGLIVGVFYVGKLMSEGGVDINNLPEKIEALSAQNSLLNMLIIPLQELIYIIFPIVTWKYIMKRPLSNMGLVSYKKGNKEFLIGLVLGILSITIVFILLIATNSAEVVELKPHFSPSQLGWLIVFILVGFAEEILVRGYVMSVLRQTRNIYAVVLISSIIFAALHGFNSGIGLLPFINLALYGVFTALIYVKSGNIWMCIGYHITWNYFQGCVFGFKVSGNDTSSIITTENLNSNLLNGGAFGPEGGIFVTIILLLGILFVQFYYKNSKYNFLADEV